MQFRGVWKLSRLKQKKTENYQAKLNKIKKLSREQTLVLSKHPPTEIRIDDTSVLYPEYLSFLNIS